MKNTATHGTGIALEDISLLRWVDVAKGIGIILVVLGHVVVGLIDSGNLPSHGAYQRLLSWIYTFHMPLFFFLSGYLAKTGNRNSNRDFLISLLQNLAYPYLLWSLLLFTSQAIASNYANHPTSVSQLLSILWKPIGVYWFLYALFIMRVLTRLVGSANLILVIGAGASLASPHMHGVARDIFYFLLFFAIGHFVRYRPSFRAKQLGAVSLIIAIPIWIAALSATAFAPTEHPLSILPLSLLGIYVTCQLSIFIPQPITNAMQYLGERSMAIYVVHIFFAAAARALTVRFFHMSSPFLTVLIITAVSIICPLLLFEIANRFGLNKIVGLGQSPKRRVLLQV